MVKSCCVKQKKQTECVEPSGYKQTKNGRLMFFCTCAECGIKKDQIRQKAGKLMEPSQAGGMLTEELFKMATKGLYNLGRAGA